MRFIRAFWGDLTTEHQKFIGEIRKCATNKSLNEIVYVWGETNNKFIKSLGYDTVMVSKDSTEVGAETILDPMFWFHKYKAIQLALNDFDDIIFMDWDVDYIKPVDDVFYEKIKEKNSKLQIPLYTFPTEGYLDYAFMRSPKLNDNWKEYTKLHYGSLKESGYILNNYLCVPCSCFIYCSDIKILNEFYELYDKTKTFSDEGVWGFWAKQNHSLDEFILNCEPSVCNAKYDWHYNQKEFNEHMNTIINKDLYFIHY
jgi:hypothetical protein